jgi:5'-3' exonuclease
MIALIDLDVVCYAVGYASEDDPVEVALGRVDEMITNIIIATGATDYQGYLSDSRENNYRYKVDPSYKANRTQAKPIHYDSIKEHLIIKHNAKIAHGMEADDALGITQSRVYFHFKGEISSTPPSVTTISPHIVQTICATIDKDILYGVPGNHYSWPIYRKGEVSREAMFIHTTEDEALRFHYLQLLKGDKSDNVRGIDGLGDKKIAKLFEGVPTNKLFDIVAQEYDLQWGDSWDKELVKNSKLLWIKRTNDETEKTPIEEAIHKLSFTEASEW